MRYVPDVWVVHVLRDPRHTVASIRDAANRYPEPFSHVFDSVERAVDNWNAAMHDSARAVGLPRQIFLPYETLARDPDQAIGQIAQQIGITPHPVAQSNRAQGLAEEAEVWKAAAIHSPVQQAKSKWSTALSAEDRALADGMIKPMPIPLAQALHSFGETGLR